MIAERFNQCALATKVESLSFGNNIVSNKMTMATKKNDKKGHICLSRKREYTVCVYSLFPVVAEIRLERMTSRL